jgi:ATP-dependent DNA ligase
VPLPRWIEPQLSKLATKAPTGPQWAHEIKFDGYRMAARIDNDDVRLLTRSGLDWTTRYTAIAEAFAMLNVMTAFIDGELCGVRPDDATSFEIMQQVAEAEADISPISPSTSWSSTAKTLRGCCLATTSRTAGAPCGPGRNGHAGQNAANAA